MPHFDHSYASHANNVKKNSATKHIRNFPSLDTVYVANNELHICQEPQTSCCQNLIDMDEIQLISSFRCIFAKSRKFRAVKI